MSDDLVEMLARAIFKGATQLPRRDGVPRFNGLPDWENLNLPEVQSLYRECAHACLSALSQGGYAVVPREPTPDMLSAGDEATAGDTTTDRPYGIWSRMLSAGEVKP